MLVHCFTITRKTDNPINVNTVHSEFGTNIPNFLQYEGGSGGCTFLCCVDIQVNVKEICDKYNYECGTLYQIHIDDNKYNNLYIIYPSYKKAGYILYHINFGN